MIDLTPAQAAPRIAALLATHESRTLKFKRMCGINKPRRTRICYPTAFFASQQCSGAAIRTALDWAARHAQRVMVACAAPEGSLARQIAAWRHEGISIDFLAGNV